MDTELLDAMLPELAVYRPKWLDWYESQEGVNVITRRDSESKPLGLCLWTKQDDEVHIHDLIVTERVRLLGHGTFMLDVLKSMTAGKTLRVTPIEGSQYWWEKQGFLPNIYDDYVYEN